MSEWFYRHHGYIYGPVSLPDLRAALAIGFVAPDDLVRERMLGDWRKAGAVRELTVLKPCEPTGIDAVSRPAPAADKDSLAGFTLVELLVVIAIIGILVGMLLPAVQSAREAGRRIACMNNQKQVGLAIHGYHDSKRCFPTGVGFTQENNGCPPGTGRYLWTFRVMPYLELANLEKMISPRSANGCPPPGGDGDSTLTVFQTEIATYQCPSDSHDRETLRTSFTWDNQTRSNYVGCFSPHGFQVEPEANEACLINGSMNGGQKTTANPTVISTSPFMTKPGRSIFNFFGVRRAMNSVTDGASRTVMVCEVISGSDFDDSEHDFRGAWWVDQGVGYSHWKTPNTPQPDRVGDAPGDKDYTSRKSGLPGWISGPGGWGAWMVAARSRHPHGVVATNADGSVTFVNETVASDVWTAVGSMNGGEAPALD